MSSAHLTRSSITSNECFFLKHMLCFIFHIYFKSDVRKYHSKHLATLGSFVPAFLDDCSKTETVPSARWKQMMKRLSAAMPLGSAAGAELKSSLVPPPSSPSPSSAAGAELKWSLARKRSTCDSSAQLSSCMKRAKSRRGGFGIKLRQLPSESSSEPKPLCGGTARGFSAPAPSDDVRSARTGVKSAVYIHRCTR